MKRNKSAFVKLALAGVFVVSIVLPLLQMFLTMSPESFLSVVQHERFGLVVANSLKVALVSTAISVSIALLLSYCISRSTIRFKNVIRVVLTFPMLIPSISHGMGLIILFGANGILTNILQLDAHIYGFTGIGIAKLDKKEEK